MLERLTADDFRPYLAGRFRVQDSLEAELIEVSDPGAAGAAGLRAPFTLVFRGPSEPVLRQGIHRLEHRDMGPLELFLVPIGPDGTGMCYEAVFG